MKIVAIPSTVLLALAATPPAAADSVDQPPNVDGFMRSHFVNVTYFNSPTLQAGVRAELRGDVNSDNGQPWDQDPCCMNPPPMRFGDEAQTMRSLLYWDFGPNGMDLTGHTVTGDATLTLKAFEWWVNTHSNLEVYAVPTTLPAPLGDVNPTDWRRLEDANGNLKEGGNGGVVFDQGAFPPNDCTNAPFPCPEGTSWNNFGRDPSRIPSNDPNVDPAEGNGCDGIGTDFCDGDDIMNMIIADKANRIAEVNLAEQLRDAVEQKKGLPFEQILPPNQEVEFGVFSNAPPVTITVPQATVQNWIDNPDDNGGLLFTMQNDRILVTVAGDGNNDKAATGQDLISVQQNFGKAEEIPSGLLEGDTNDDGQVTGLDLIFVQQNFGNTEETVPTIAFEPNNPERPGGFAVSNNFFEFWQSDTLPFQSSAWPRLAFETTPPNGDPVPEPAAMGMMGLAGLLISKRLRKWNR